jgi:Raf kinase inhibitor-like YbhB/YbcL family protein
MYNRTHLLMAAALSCAVAAPMVLAAEKPPTGEPKAAVMLLHAKNAAKLTVTSTSFANNGVLAEVYTQNGQNKSPALSWTAGPADTQSYVVLAEDTGVKRAEPIDHWVVYDIPANTTMLPEGLGVEAKLVSPMGAIQGKNIANKVGYIGPKPPAGETHPYHFEVFALDKKLDLLPDKTNRNAVVNAMKGHVLAQGEMIAEYTGKKTGA